MSKRKNRRYKTRYIYSRILDTMTCQICGEGHNATLDFHHVNPETKSFTISDMKSKDYSPQAIVEEISKCACLCSNCHRKLHYQNKFFVERDNMFLKKENKHRLTKTVELATKDWIKLGLTRIGELH